MTEISVPWGGTSTGDKGPYTSTQWADIWATLFTVDRTKQGIVSWYAGKLAITTSTNNVAVATGAAIVHGTFYKNDATVNINIPSASATTRTDYIVLRKNHTAQTVRLTRLAGTEGGAEPSLTQNATTYWDIKIGEVVVDAAGEVTLTPRVNNIYLNLGVPTDGVIYSTSTTLPYGFAELGVARGRFIVGMPSGGTIKGTLGTALTDLGTFTHTHEYKQVVAHTHSAKGYNDGDAGTSPRSGYSWGLWLTKTTVWYDGYIGTTGSSTCNTEAASSTPPYLQLMTLVKV
jgi:hypothetical protein